MGQQQNKDSAEVFLKNFDQKFMVEKIIPDSNTQILKSRQNQTIYLMKQISMTSTDDFNAYVQKIKRRRDLKHQHYLSIQEFYTKSQNSFCSTFHRISLIYQYSNHSLQNEIDARINQDRKFEEKQIWSILCSCSLALAYLLRNNITFTVLNPQQIFLTSQGVIKLVDPQISTNALNGLMIRADQYYSPEFLKNNLLKQSNKGCVFSLGMCLLHVMLLQSMSICYSYQQLCINDRCLQQKIEMIKSRGFTPALINVIDKMLKIKEVERFGVLDLQQYLFKLIDQNASQADEQSRRHSGVIQQKQIQETQLQKQIISTIIQPLQSQKQQSIQKHVMPFEQDIQNPDQSEEKQDQMATQRSNNFMLTQNYAKIIQSKAQQSMNNSYQKSNIKQSKAQIKVQQQTSQDDISHKYTLNNQKLATPKLQTQNVLTNSKGDTIFTDPKLMDMLKKDLQIINLKRSKILTNADQQRRLSFSRSQNSRNSIVKQTKNSYPKQSIQDITENNTNLNTNAKKSSRVYQHPLEEIQIPQNNQGYHISQSNQSKNAFSKKKTQPQIQGLRFVNQTFARGRYQGQKLGNYRHGYGTFYYKQGGKYTGYWFSNKMHGKGTLYYSNNKIAYQGDWKQDRLWGYGVLYNQEPKILQDSYDFSSWNEIDEYWVKYEGNFEEDNKCGKGKLYLSNRQIFEGMFVDDEVNGEGTFYRRDGEVIKGFWKENVLAKRF